MSVCRNLMSLGALFAAGAIWYAPNLFHVGHAGDEVAYFQAFELLIQGRAPTDAPRYVYLPAFAHAGALCASYSGMRATTLLIRSLNLAAVALLAWTSVGLIPSLRHGRLACSVLALVGFRPLIEAIELGNLSPVAAVTTLGGLALSAGHPLAAGLVLGMGCAVKPFGVGAVLILLVCRGPDDVGPRPYRAAAIVAIAIITGAVLIDLPSFSALLARASSDGSFAASNLSLHRILAGIGLRPPSAMIGFVWIAVCGMWARRRNLNRAGLIAIGCLASVYWVSRVWVHSFCLLLPAVTLATARAVQFTRQAFVQGRFEASPETCAYRGEVSVQEPAIAACVVLGVVSIWAGDAWGELGNMLPSIPLGAALGALVPFAGATFLSHVAMLGNPILVTPLHGLHGRWRGASMSQSVPQPQPSKEQKREASPVEHSAQQEKPKKQSDDRTGISQDNDRPESAPESGDKLP